MVYKSLESRFSLSKISEKILELMNLFKVFKDLFFPKVSKLFLREFLSSQDSKFTKEAFFKSSKLIFLFLNLLYKSKNIASTSLGTILKFKSKRKDK